MLASGHASPAQASSDLSRQTTKVSSLVTACECRGQPMALQSRALHRFEPADSARSMPIVGQCSEKCSTKAVSGLANGIPATARPCHRVLQVFAPSSARKPRLNASLSVDAQRAISF